MSGGEPFPAPICAINAEAGKPKERLLLALHNTPKAGGCFHLDAAHSTGLWRFTGELAKVFLHPNFCVNVEHRDKLVIFLSSATLVWALKQFAACSKKCLTNGERALRSAAKLVGHITGELNDSHCSAILLFTVWCQGSDQTAGLFKIRPLFKLQ